MRPFGQANNDVRESVTDDDDDDAAKDGVGGNDHTVRFFIINNVSRATSRASDDDDDDAASVESNDAWMVELIVEQVRNEESFQVSVISVLTVVSVTASLASSQQANSFQNCYTCVPVTCFWSTYLSVFGINTSSASAVSPLS